MTSISVSRAPVDEIRRPRARHRGNRYHAAWLATGLLASACAGGGAGPAGGPGGGPPPMPVEIMDLQSRPIEQTTEFVATVKSRRSSTIQPQVEGFITRIAVRSGDRVGAGATLFEVDSRPQQAVVASQESMRTMRAAELEYARQDAARTRKLFEAGAVSQREAEAAETALRTAEAQLKAADEQVQQQGAELGYYRVKAPAAGIVGDIPIRVGDRVTKSTELTTVNEQDAFEVYISVPVSQARDLRLGLPVRLTDEAGASLSTEKITFISPRVDPATQTVLAKAAVAGGSGRMKADQFVRARVVWRSEPGLTLPVTAALRVNGQYFAFVAEKGENGLSAKQRAVKLGDIIGNDYVVLDGLKPGDQLIVGGLQKIGDGSPVTAAAPPSEKPPASEPTKGS